MEAEEITKEELEKAIQNLKTKKASDFNNMKNELIKYGGGKLKSSLLTLLNEVLRKAEVPERWKVMIIKSIYKNKGKRNEMANQRGIFLTSVISKIFERILLNRSKEVLEENMSPFQCGGRSGRGIVDHLFTVRALIDEARYYNRDLYMYYGDLEKCFDKLWLRDSIIEVWKAGVPAREVMLIYKMNEEANIVVDTPFGRTEKVRLREVVRQGTIWGPTLCAVATEKINSIGEKVSTLYSESTNIESLIFVDDICGAGSRETVGKVIGNCRTIEERKKMTFNEKKSNYQILEFGKKRERKEIDERVKKGPIKRTNNYKYMGEHVNNKANYDDSIDHKEKKVPGVSKAIKVNAESAGNLHGQVADKLYNTSALPYISFNMETWTNIQKQEMARIEKLQKDILTTIYGMPRTTPYEAFLSELGVWPMRHYVGYKKLLLLHNLMHSENNRVAKQVLLDQINKNIPNCWYEEIKQMSQNYQIELNNVTNSSKGEWVESIKRAINETVESGNWRESTKSRFVKSCKREKYIDETSKEETRKIMKVRLNMLDLKMNYKGKYPDNRECPVCKISDDTTEHLFECLEIKKRMDVELARINKNDVTSEDTSKLKMLIKYVKKAFEVREKF